MAMRFFQGILVSSVALFFISFVYISPVFAVSWFATFDGGVISGRVPGSEKVVSSIQPSFGTTGTFKSAIVQPGNTEVNEPNFIYGGIVATSDAVDVKIYTSPITVSSLDGRALNTGLIGSRLPEHSSYLDVASDIALSCTTPDRFFSCSLTPGIYKATTSQINNSFSNLGANLYSIPSPGLLIIVENATDPSAGTISINNNIATSATTNGVKDRRLVLVALSKIIISENVGSNAAVYLTRAADLQMMFISNFPYSASTPSIEVKAASLATPVAIKLEGPIVSKGKISFKRSLAATIPPPVIVRLNPLYVSELAKSGLYNVFGSSDRWIYE